MSLAKRYEHKDIQDEDFAKNIDDEFRNIYGSIQSKVKESDKAVVATQGANGEFRIFTDSAGLKYMEFKSGNDWYRSAAFTKVT